MLKRWKNKAVQKRTFPTLPKPKKQVKSYFLYISQPHHMENFIPQIAAYQKGTIVWKKGAIIEILLLP